MELFKLKLSARADKCSACLMTPLSLFVNISMEVKSTWTLHRGSCCWLRQRTIWSTLVTAPWLKDRKRRSLAPSMRRTFSSTTTRWGGQKRVTALLYIADFVPFVYIKRFLSFSKVYLGLLLDGWLLGLQVLPLHGETELLHGKNWNSSSKLAFFYGSDFIHTVKSFYVLV